MKIRPKENWSAFQNVHGKLARKIFLQEYLAKQCSAAIDSEPMSLPVIRWRSLGDVTGDQPISFTIKRVNLKCLGIFLASIVHEDFLEADITDGGLNRQ